jgi:NAD(P)-dependent dehydrogenase (short-subunit alcohol dehydrogenase family)
VSGGTAPGAALVTGAAQGIGRATAGALARMGWAVAACDRDERVFGTVEEIVAAGGRAAAAVFDVADADAAAKGHDEVVARLGPIDVVVANAGIVDNIAHAERMSPDAWRREVDINLSGAYFTIRPALSAMRERRCGRVVAISSVAAAGGLRGQVGYSATKAGLLGLVRALALEMAPFGGTANAVLPGFIATDRVKGMPPAIQERVLASIPLRRYGGLEEVAGLVAFLASPTAAYITGACIPVDGGFLLSQLTLGRDADHHEMPG